MIKMKITTKFLEEIEEKIRELRRALRRKERLDKLGNTITIDVPLFRKQIDYTITQADKDLIEQEATDKENEFKDKLKEIDKEK